MDRRSETSVHSDHPSEEDWEQLAMGELVPEARLSLMDHVVRCSECQRILRTLGELEASARAAGEPIAREISSAPGLLGTGQIWRRALPWAAAASVALAFLAVWSSLEPIAPESVAVPTQRSFTLEPAGPVLLTPADGAIETVIPGTSIILSWIEVPGADHYVVELFDGEAELLWAGPSSQLSISWPDSIPPVSNHYYWRVSAWRGSEELSTSRLERFELRSKP